MRSLNCLKLQLDEVWSFVAAKEKNVPSMKNPVESGISVTWVAIDAETKLLPCWWSGFATWSTPKAFVCDLASRLAHRVQITTDGLRAYVEAMEAGFAGEVDYAQLHKVYGESAARRFPYLPAQRASVAKSAASVGTRTRRTFPPASSNGRT